MKNNSITSPSKSSKSSEPIRSILTQHSTSPHLPTRQNGLQHVTISPKVTSPVYANTSNQSQLSPQPPPVPAKPKYRTSNTQFVPINGDDHSSKIQTHNGFDVDEV